MRRPPLLILPIVMLAVLAIGCRGASKPEGWMPPSPVTAEGVLDGDTLYISRDAGKISSFDASGDALVENWSFGGKGKLSCAN